MFYKVFGDEFVNGIKILFVDGFFHELPHKLFIVFNHHCIISLPENISLAAELIVIQTYSV